MKGILSAVSNKRPVRQNYDMSLGSPKTNQIRYDTH